MDFTILPDVPDQSYWPLYGTHLPMFPELSKLTTAHPIWVPRLFAQGAARSVVRSKKVGWIYPHSSHNSRQSHRATRSQKQHLFRLIILQNSSKMKKQLRRRRPRETEFSGTDQTKSIRNTKDGAGSVQEYSNRGPFGIPGDKVEC